MRVRTRVVQVNPDAPERAVLREAADSLRHGGLVAFPTETVYGLGANALDGMAVARLFEAKGRPAANPVIVHVASAVAARALTTCWPETAERLAARFWPGPLTLILPRVPQIPDLVTAGGPTVGLRMPAHPVALALLTEADLAIAAPSANRSSRVSPTTAAHVARSLEGRIDLILDAGATPRGIESTVLDLTTDVPRLLRPGPITRRDLERMLGEVVTGAAEEAGPVRSPGRVGRHYAPSARLEIAADGGWPRVLALARQGVRVGWLTFEVVPGPAAEGAEIRLMPAEPAAYGAALYAVLHELDAVPVQHIVVGEPPDTDSWAAVRDRLLRAAAPPTDSA